ncbi:MAG: penicillin-binding protein 2 [Candidatus Pacebacteria bacterium]|nr:penicillin-binding protein 2 [Candidatus Paceibacterota bacterium]
MSRFRTSKNYNEIEPNEILIDSLAQKKAEEIDWADRKLEVPLYRFILQGFFFFCLLVLFVLFVKTFQMQVAQGEDYSKMAQQNQFIIHRIQAERGIVYDRNEEQLVFNRSSFDLIGQKSFLPEKGPKLDNVLREVSKLIKKEPEDLEKMINGADSQILVSENLDHQTLILLESKISDLPGFSIKNSTVREYLDGENFSHLLGYTGKIKSEEYAANSQLYSINDSVGREGIESAYEEILRKNPGELRIERDAAGNVLSEEIFSLPQSGQSLVLNIDAGLQRKIKSVLESALGSAGTKKAAAVALDPRNGNVLALVSLPEFDNNLFQKGGDSQVLQDLLVNKDKTSPLLNRAIAGRYLTGSVIKPLIASGVLEEKLIEPEKKINCKGEISIPNQYNPEIEYKFTDLHIHGWTNMKKAIAESCNIYFMTVGGGYGDQKGLGPTKIKSYLEVYGWNQKSGIDLPGEKAGFIPDKDWKKQTFKEGWWDGDTYNLSIGGGYLQITPLEVANSYAAIANGGTLYKPQIVHQVVEGSKGSLEIIKEFEPEVIRQNFISKENLETVREGMRQAVTAENSPLATAYDLNFLPVSAAAKTGTAETSRIGYFNSWISAFAPYNNPEIVLTLMIEDVNGLQRLVTPAAREILEYYFTRNELERK